MAARFIFGHVAFFCGLSTFFQPLICNIPLLLWRISIARYRVWVKVSVRANIGARVDIRIRVRVVVKVWVKINTRVRVRVRMTHL